MMNAPKRIEDMHPRIMHDWKLLLLNSIYGKVDMHSPYRQQLRLDYHNIKDVTPKGEMN